MMTDHSGGKHNRVKIVTKIAINCNKKVQNPCKDSLKKV